MGLQNTVSREKWLAARKSLLAREKAFNKKRDELSAMRRDMPFVQIEDEYVFQTEDGEQTLLELFGSHKQLIIYHFMYGPDWEEGCPSCSLWADNFDGIDVHLAARNTAFACVSNASLAKLLTYRKRLGWSFKWVSAETSSFSADFGVSFHQGDESKLGAGYNYSGKVFGKEMPGISVFTRGEDNTILHSYSTYSRGLDMLNGMYHFLDLTPLGRDEEK
ncbi:MAG: DUF899 domain-containing protein, partial [Hyphomicrobiales bacterium]